MENALIILNQLFTMVIYIAIGYVLHRTKLVSAEGCKSLANLLLYLILPCVIFKAFLREASRETSIALGLSLLCSAVFLFIAMLVSRLMFKKNPVDNFSSSFSNAGFMGIPLITASIGSEAVFYIAGFVALLNIFQWFYGQRLLAGDHSKLNLLSILKNPLVIAFVAGLIFYFPSISLPKQLDTCVSAIASCNAPIAMIILGYYLCELPLLSIFKLPSAYLVSFARLLLIPLLSLLAVAWVKGIQIEIKMALVIAASAPVGTNVAVYARKLDKDYPRAVTMICLSTLFCIVTMPLMIYLLTLISA